MTYRAWWNEQTRDVASLADLDRLLDELHERFTQEDPSLVSVEHRAGGPCLSIGLGLRRSVLNYVGVDGDPPYFTSVSGADDEETEGESTISFLFNGELSEFPVENSVPLARARVAFRQFCETNVLPDAIEWEEA
jgi:hypothetical protein